MIIAATYDSLSNSIFQHFGKTQSFKIYQIEDGKIVSSKVIGNGGFGHHDLATYLRDLNVEILILGNSLLSDLAIYPKSSAIICSAFA